MKPEKIVHLRSRNGLELHFRGSSPHFLTAEFLRVHSPSAEVRGHGNQTVPVPVNKQSVSLVQIVPQGQYAVKLIFDDGHDSGIYTWAYLHELARDQEHLWQDYCARRDLELERRAGNEPVRWIP